MALTTQHLREYEEKKCKPIPYIEAVLWVLRPIPYIEDVLWVLSWHILSEDAARAHRAHYRLRDRVPKLSSSVLISVCRALV